MLSNKNKNKNKNKKNKLDLVLAPRVLVFTLLRKIYIEKLSLSVLEPLFESQIAPHHAWVKSFVYGVLRGFFYLEKIGLSYLNKPFKKKDQDVFLILLMGLYELKERSTPNHAVLFETVNLLENIKKTWAKGVVNACLRKALAENLNINTNQFPGWLEDAVLRSIKNSYGVKNNITKNTPDLGFKDFKDLKKELEKIISESLKEPPIFLRVNLLKTSRSEYLEKLKIIGVQAKIVESSNAAIELEKTSEEGVRLTTGAIGELPGFAEGLFYVQDLSPQWMPECLSLKSDLFILDACAAPGGKALHLLEQAALKNSQLVCLDSDPKRFERLKLNFQRAQIDFSETSLISLEKNTVQLLKLDAMELNQTALPKLFDLILLDAPCSATGVIRRHPDILLLRKEEDLKTLVTNQKKLLNHLLGLLAPGGVLLYMTCSILEQENDGVVRAFFEESLENPKKFQLEALTLPVGRATPYGWQIFPGEGEGQGGDGFYYAKILRIE